MGPGGSKPGGAVEADKGEALLNEDAAFGGEDGVRDGPRAGEVLVHPRDGLVLLAGRVLADGRADDARAEQRLGPRRALVAEDLDCALAPASFTAAAHWVRPFVT